MSEFKPGDKVRWVDHPFIPDHLDRGTTYNVLRVNGRYVYLKEDPHRGWVPSRFELVEEPVPDFEQEFKKGDLVRLKAVQKDGALVKGASLRHGTVYTVLEVQKYAWSRDLMVTVVVSGDKANWSIGPYYAWRFERVIEMPAAVVEPVGYIVRSDNKSVPWHLGDNLEKAVRAAEESAKKYPGAEICVYPIAGTPIKTVKAELVVTSTDN